MGNETLNVIQISKDSYRAYGAVTDFKNFRGEPMPEWDNLPEKIKTAWIKASTHAFTEGMNFSSKLLLKEVEEIK